MTGIFKKEWGHYFKTMTGFVFIAMYLALSGAVFTMTNLLSQSADIKSYFSVFTTYVIFLFPILTMSIFSEERRQKTDELLFTAPVSLTAVVLGKFFATLCVFLLPMLLTLVYPLTLSFFGVSAVFETAGNYLGLAMLAMACIAIGEFLSLLTDSQFVAAMMTYSIFALLLFAGMAIPMVPQGILSSLLSFFAVTTHCSGFSYGVFDLTQIVYFFSITALFLYLSVFVLEYRRLS